MAEVRGFLGDRVEAAVAAGIELDRSCVDPGIGFGKTLEHNLAILREIRAFHHLGVPVLVGPSRKRFIGTLTGAEVGDRIEGTAGVVAWCAAEGVDIVRVHDVKEMTRVVRVVDAIARRRDEPGRMTPEAKRRAPTSGGAIAYTDDGDGPPVVLIHGFPQSSFVWRDLGPLLSSRFRVIVPDLLGSGDSDQARARAARAGRPGRLPPSCCERLRCRALRGDRALGRRWGRAAAGAGPRRAWTRWS